MKKGFFIVLFIMTFMLLVTSCSTIAFNYTDTDKVMASTNDNVMENDNEEDISDNTVVDTPIDNEAAPDDTSDSTNNDTTQEPDEDEGEDMPAINEDAESDIKKHTSEQPEEIDFNAIDVLVNKHNALPSDYKPEDLVIPNVKFSFDGEDEKKYIREEAANALELLFEAAKEDNIHLFAVSGFRSYSRQKAIFDRNVNKHGFEKANTFSAQPGQSEHQSGLAMDVSCSEVGYRLTQSFGETKEGLWVKENAHKYGFIVRYPKEKEDITGYMYEPWHLRYIGTDIASDIYERQITLEEYFEQLDTE